MKMTKELNKLFNDQIKLEYESAFLYLSMSEWLEENDWPGAANWMYVQYKEELSHAEGFFRYLTMVGEEVELEQLDKPEKEWDSIQDLFKAALKHEEYISSQIDKMAKQAEEDGDRPSREFLTWYIKEQVEEEVNATDNVVCVTKAEGHIPALMQFDASRAQRTFGGGEVPLL